MAGEMGDALPFVDLATGRTVKAIAGGLRLWEGGELGRPAPRREAVAPPAHHA